MSRIAVSLVVLLLAAAAAATLVLGVRSLDTPLQLGAPLTLQSARGCELCARRRRLGRQGVIANPRVWILYARLKGLAQAVKAGEYEVQPGTTPRELLSKMVNGQVLLHSFTIVDGWRYRICWPP